MPAFGTQQFDTWNVKKRIISDDFSLYNTFAIFTKHQSYIRDESCCVTMLYLTDSEPVRW